MINDNLTIYHRCNMSKGQHIFAYIICSVVGFAVAMLFYHVAWVSVIVGFAVGVLLERLYAASTISKRQKTLRLQFRDFLASMCVAVRAGNVETGALRFALDDLRLSYGADADIVREVEGIIRNHDGGGIEYKLLFEDLAQRSDLEDIRSFARVYSVIEGKSDRFGEVLTNTAEVIGDKIEVEQEIETTITSAKSETMMMLLMPIIIVGAMSVMGGGMMSALFETAVGHVAATAALIIFAVSFVIAAKATDIRA